MSFVDDTRWSCPRVGCRHTVTFDGPPEYVAVARMAEQKRHGKAHREADALERKLRKIHPLMPLPKKWAS